VIAASNNDQVFTSGRDGTLRLWSADTGEPLGVPMTGHNGPVLGLAYDAATRQVISGGPDGTLAVRPMDGDRWIDRGCAVFTRTLTRQEYARFKLSAAKAEPCRDFLSAGFK
jgi:WD40 repeat protein